MLLCKYIYSECDVERGMHFFLVLSAVQALIQPLTFNPTAVVAGELTQIQLTLQDGQICLNNKLPYVQILVKGTEALIDFTKHLTDFKPNQNETEIIDGLRTREVQLVYSLGTVSNHKIDFLYFDLNPTTTSHPLTITISCVSLDANKAVNASSVLLPTQGLNIAVTAAPAFPEVVKLTPSETNSTLVSSISLSAPWPTQCRKEKNPTIRLSLDADTIKAGGALSSDTNSDYTILGFKNTTGEEIKSNEIKKDGFHSLEFKRLYHDLHNQLNLAFKFQAQEVPAATAKDTPIEVKFICDKTEVKVYSKEKAPSIKVNQAIPTSFTLATLLLPILVFFG